MLFGTTFLGFAKLTNLWKMTKTPPKFQGPHLPKPWLQRCCLTSGRWMGIKKISQGGWSCGGNPYPHGCVSQIKLKVYLVGGFSPTHLKNMFVKIGSSSPSFGVQIKNFWKPPPSYVHYYTCPRMLVVTGSLGVALSKEYYPETFSPPRPQENAW